MNQLGGTVAQAVAPTIYGLERPRGHGFESDLLSFPDPSSIHLISCPKTFTVLSSKGKKAQNKYNKINTHKLHLLLQKYVRSHQFVTHTHTHTAQHQTAQHIVALETIKY